MQRGQTDKTHRRNRHKGTDSEEEQMRRRLIDCRSEWLITGSALNLHPQGPPTCMPVATGPTCTTLNRVSIWSSKDSTSPTRSGNVDIRITPMRTGYIIILILTPTKHNQITIGNSKQSVWIQKHSCINNKQNHTRRTVMCGSARRTQNMFYLWRKGRLCSHQSGQHSTFWCSAGCSSPTSAK